MSAGDRYQVKLYGLYLSRPTVNVFWFNSDSGPSSALDVAIAFDGHNMTLLSHFCNAAASWQRIEALNFDDPTDFAIHSPGVAAGVQTSEALPSFVTWTFIYDRATRLVRNGYKRFAGVSEGNQVSGVPTSAVLTDLDAMAAALGAVFGGAGTVYSPKIPRVTYPSPNPLHLPPTSVTLYPITGVRYDRIGSQNSRK